MLVTSNKSDDFIYKVNCNVRSLKAFLKRFECKHFEFAHAYPLSVWVGKIDR